MDLQNPAVTRHTTLTPADLEVVPNNPELIRNKARQQLLVQVQYTHDQMANPNTPLTQRMKFIEILAQLADAYPKANVLPAAATEKFNVNIILDQSVVGNKATATIDVAAKEVVDAEPKAAADVEAAHGLQAIAELAKDLKDSAASYSSPIKQNTSDPDDDIDPDDPDADLFASLEVPEDPNA